MDIIDISSSAIRSGSAASYEFGELTGSLYFGGGGHGGKFNNTGLTSGTNNTGGGGGAGAPRGSCESYTITSSGSAGGSGIVIIRNTR